MFRIPEKSQVIVFNIIFAARIAFDDRKELAVLDVDPSGLFGNAKEKSFVITPVFPPDKFKGYSLLFIFAADDKVRMQVMRGEEKCGRPADLTNDIDDCEMLARDIYLKIVMEAGKANREKSGLHKTESKREENVETISKPFTVNISVFSKIIEASRSALHKHGTLDKVKTPGIMFGDDEFSCKIIPICPEGYHSEYSFVFRINKHGSSMQILDGLKAVQQPASMDEYIEDTAKLEQAISRQIDSFIGDKLMQKEKAPTFLERFPNIASSIYILADAARRAFVSFGAEDDVRIVPGFEPYNNMAGICFYVNPVMKEDEFTEYALHFTIDEDGTSMKIIREGNDWGIPKVIDDAMVSPKEIAAFIRQQIREQVLRDDTLIHER